MALTSFANKRLVNFGPYTQATYPRTPHLCRVSLNYKQNYKPSTRATADEKVHVVHDEPTRGAPHANPTTRRAVIIALATGIISFQPRQTLAEEEVTLPKEYRQLVKRLSDGLSESIEAEASGASEAEVRRKADPAKETVREFVRKWRDNPRVSTDLSHAELKEALSELGEFYMAYGQRTKLSPPVRESVLKHLMAAKEALPAEPEKKGSGPLGLF